MTTQHVIRNFANNQVEEMSNASGAAFTYHLPVVSGGRSVTVVDVGNNFATYNCTVIGSEGTLINGLANYVMNVNKEAVTFGFDGAGWVILSNYNTSGGGAGTETGQVISAGGTYTLSSVTAGSPTNFIVTTASAVTINIPAPNVGSPWGRVNISGYNVAPNITITPASGNINGASSALVNTAYGSMSLLDFGTGWMEQ